MQISGELKIFKKEINGKTLYSTSLTNKNIDGTYENMYIAAQLPRGITLENNTKINVTRGFISFYRSKTGLAQPKVVIQEFEAIKPIDTPNYIEETTRLFADTGEVIAENTIGYYQNDDLPF